MDTVLDELVTSLEKLSSEDDDGGGTITDLSILDLGKFDEDLGGGVSDLKLLENGSTIVGDSDITDVVDEHLIETLRAKRSLDDVRKGEDGENVLGANILTLLSLTEHTNL